jgi:hypothetical protein
MVCESSIIYGVQLWELDAAWKEIDNIHGRCKKLLRLPRCAANSLAENELRRERGDDVGVTKYWQRIISMEIQNSVRECYERKKLHRPES